MDLQIAVHYRSASIFLLPRFPGSNEPVGFDGKLWSAMGEGVGVRALMKVSQFVCKNLAYAKILQILRFVCKNLAYLPSSFQLWQSFTQNIKTFFKVVLHDSHSIFSCQTLRLTINERQSSSVCHNFLSEYQDNGSKRRSNCKLELLKFVHRGQITDG